MSRAASEALHVRALLPGCSDCGRRIPDRHRIARCPQSLPLVAERGGSDRGGRLGCASKLTRLVAREIVVGGGVAGRVPGFSSPWRAVVSPVAAVAVTAAARWPRPVNVGNRNARACAAPWFVGVEPPHRQSNKAAAYHAGDQRRAMRRARVRDRPSIADRRPRAAADPSATRRRRQSAEIAARLSDYQH